MNSENFVNICNILWQCIAKHIIKGGIYLAKKDWLKGLVSGVLISSLLFASINAAPIRKSLAVFFNNMQVVVDGVKINPTDAKGNKVEPFTYEGTIYMPLRAVAEALGKDVTWDQKTYTAYLGKAKKDVVGLNELIPWDESSDSHASSYKGVGWSGNDNQFIMSQKNYTIQNSLSVMFDSWEYDKGGYENRHQHKDGSILFQSTWGGDWWEWHKTTVNEKTGYTDYHYGGNSSNSYKLNKEYYKLAGTFGIDDLSDSGVNANLVIKDGDGNELYSSISLSKGDTPIIIDVDILDKEQIEIIISSSEEGIHSPKTLYAQFTDVKLYKVEN